MSERDTKYSQIAFEVPNQVHAIYKAACAKLGVPMAAELRAAVWRVIIRAGMADELDTATLESLEVGEL